jgi:hypothetical protein
VCGVTAVVLDAAGRFPGAVPAAPAGGARLRAEGAVLALASVLGDVGEFAWPVLAGLLGRDVTAADRGRLDDLAAAVAAGEALYGDPLAQDGERVRIENRQYEVLGLLLGGAR